MAKKCLSERIQDWISRIDALSGKCFTMHEETEPLLSTMPKDMVLVCGDVLFTGLAEYTEHLIAKPVYYIEKALGLKPDPVWIFSKSSRY